MLLGGLIQTICWIKSNTISNGLKIVCSSFSLIIFSDFCSSASIHCYPKQEQRREFIEKQVG